MTPTDLEKLEVGDKVYSFLKMTKSIMTFIYHGEGKFRQEIDNVHPPRKFSEKELKQLSLNLDEQYITLYQLEIEELNSKLQWHKEQMSDIESKIKTLDDGYGYLKDDYPEHFL